MELRLDLKLSQKLVMTPQLQQAIKLLQLSRLELEQVLSQHLMENPLLEEDVAEIEEEVGTEDSPVQEKLENENVETPEASDSGTEITEFSEPLATEDFDNNYDNDWPSGPLETTALSDDDFPSYEQTLTRPPSLEEHLLWQMRLSSLTPHECAIGHMLIGNLDEDGYLRASLSEIAEDAHESVEVVEDVLKQIQTFDPPGVAARDLRECLLIQLNYLEHGPIGSAGHGRVPVIEDLAKTIVTDHLPELQKKRYAQLAKTLHVSTEDVFAAVHIIEGLEPKPGRPYFIDNNHAIVPDVFVMKHEGEWVVILNEDGIPKLRINTYYKRMMAGSEDDGGKTKAYLEDKLRGAQWIIRSIDQRNKTIVKVVKSLIRFQEAFLEKGVQYLKPLVLRQVAEDVEMHESTISRVTTNKYMFCPQGMLELKYFFNAGIQRGSPGAEHLSSVTVRELIRDLVAKEDPQHPLKDQEIMALLKKRDIIIARRTVAKYRVELNIPPANQRKRII